MSLSQNDILKAIMIKQAVEEYFQSTNESKVQAKQLMDLFIEKGIFSSNHRDGLPIRNLLRDLYKTGQLGLIPQVHYEQKAQNKYWFFIRTKPNELTQEEFLIQNLLEGATYREIEEKYNVSRSQLKDWYSDQKGEKLKFIIIHARKLYSSRYNSQSEQIRSDFTYFSDKGKRYFYNWIKTKPRHCYYCKTEEEILKVLFHGILANKRSRGKVLELERKSTTDSKYNEENCELACYVCNNAKSDFISEEDFFRYFANPIGEYLNQKYQEQHDNRAAEK